MVTYDEIKKANDQVTATDIKGRPYMEVNQRIKAFRMLYPQGFILTEMTSNDNGICIFRATVGFYDENGNAFTLGTGSAYEVEGSTFINKTSYIENCETSAVGRALGMAGFGIDTSVASYEEVANAMANQTEPQKRKASPKQIELLKKYYKGDNLAKLLESNKIEKIEDIALEKASELIGKITGGK